MRSVRNLSDLSLRAVLFLFGGVGIVVMVAPVVIGFLMSLTNGSTLRFPPEGLSFRWYALLFDPAASSRIQASAMTSLEIAMFATLLSAVITIPAALGLVGRRARRYAVLESILIVPLLLPTLVYGVAALIFFSLIGIPTSRWLVILGHAAVFMPLSLLAIIAILSQLDPGLGECSRVLGATRLQTFRWITLPLIIPAVIGGGFLVFMSSLDNVSVSLFLSDARTNVLPIRMWRMIEESLDVRVAAISGVVIVATLILMLGTTWIELRLRRRIGLPPK